LFVIAQLFELSRNDQVKFLENTEQGKHDLVGDVVGEFNFCGDHPNHIIGVNCYVSTGQEEKRNVGDRRNFGVKRCHSNEECNHIKDVAKEGEHCVDEKELGTGLAELFSTGLGGLEYVLGNLRERNLLGGRYRDRLQEHMRIWQLSDDEEAKHSACYVRDMKVDRCHLRRVRDKDQETEHEKRDFTDGAPEKRR